MKVGNGKQKRLRLDLYIFIPAVLISIIGIFTLLSTTIGNDGKFNDLSIVYKQIGFVVFGLITYLVVSKIDISLFKYVQIIIPIYLITIILLVLVFILGPVINNVQRWLVVGGIQIQPSEIAKITVILVTASIFSFKHRYNQWLLFLISFIAVLPIFLLVYFEPAGSMSFLILFIWFLVAFTGLSNQLRNTVALIVVGLVSSSLFLISFTDNWIYILLSIAAIVISILAYYYRDNWRVLIVISFLIGIMVGSTSVVLYKNVLKEYQKDRIEAFLNPTENTKDIGFNVNQARIAIGSGQIWGKGFGNGTQSKRDFLPEHQTDFIFASYAEEFGLVGSLFLLVLFSVITIRVLNISIDNARNTFLSMILIGVTMKMVLEIFINIGTNLGVIPATGIPLPLVSAGGTITVMTLFSLGVVQSIINSSNVSKNNRNIIDNY
ncbi:MAG TPA: rod shape-determining protein RodA [Candidatus Dojkabacteria bacterium]|nr:rod shape-determining protein RodA [Candidatus Dojkabacteria bacterium]